MSEYRTAWEQRNLRARWGAYAEVSPGEIKADHDRIRALEAALERVMHNFQLAVAGKPVRDMAETLAEARAALQRPDDHRQPSQDERPDGQADG